MPTIRLTASVAGALVVLALASVAPPVAAQGAAGDAEALFQRGVASMRAGDYPTGCPALRESYELEPLPGVLFTLAECEAAWGKLAAAAQHYQAFLDTLTSLSQARRDVFEERRRIAAEKMAALSAVMPAITIDVAPGSKTGLLVMRNGVVVDRASLGVTQKVDPGEYVVTAQAAGAPVWERRVKLEERSNVRIEVPFPLPSADSRGAESPGPGAVEAGPAPDRPSSARSPLRSWAYVAGGVGVAGLATGVIAGLSAMSDKRSVDAGCANHLCNAAGLRAVDAGRTSALISTIAFPVGLAGIGTSALLFVVAHKADAPDAGSGAARPSVASLPGGALVTLEGTF